MQRALNEILRYQNEDGGWWFYPGGPANISFGVKCYFALKLMGCSAGRSGDGARRGSGFWRTAAW